ncbi:MAG: tRNA lysidine(34) synthetase TilS [Psychroserpens sp.]|uniref:tRNA lysidine(34) synthetase TilS n=1 Tax=Psychroserpens sp. TaxID=2020870 RepID=UPI003C783436
MKNQFKSHIDKNLSFLNNGRLLIAISGGLDSVVLTHFCHQLQLNIALAHCNFNLRGNESNDDEAFVLNLAEELDLEVFIEHFDTEIFAKTEKLSTQMAARELRYEWFTHLATDLDFDYILTAHHADDNLETVLINLTRGTGLSGLTGIPEINGNIIRPLLPFSRDTLETYAKDNSLKWQEDSSNASDKYLRNRMRHHVIPALKKTSPELLQNVNKTINNLKDTADIVEESLRAVAKRAIVDIDGDKIVFDVMPFIKANNPKAYLFEMFREYGFTAWDDIVDLLDAQPGKQILSDGYRLVKDRGHIILTKRSYAEENIQHKSIDIESAALEIETPIGHLLFKDVDHISEEKNNIIFVDKAILKFPLKFRPWQKGDAFYPLGMAGKKKLSKYFKDEKLSLVDKEQAYVLVSEENIIWVVGMRADDRFKVTPKTTDILRIALK